eukprot:scaffold326725_cov142-Tisochrysis_lutea.AAC.1
MSLGWIHAFHGIDQGLVPEHVIYELFYGDLWLLNTHGQQACMQVLQPFALQQQHRLYLFVAGR